MSFKKIIGELLWKCPVTKKYMRDRADKITRDILQKNGYMLIEEIQNALKITNEIFFMDFGTLLGIIREGRIISHDMDIDVGVNITNPNTIENIRKSLIDAGCSFCYENIIEGFGIGQDTFSKYDIHFDIYYYYENEGVADVLTLFRRDNKVYSDDKWEVVKLTSKPVINTKLYSFMNVKVNVPENYEEHLVNRYGNNWRIPDKNYIYWDSFSSTITDLQGYMQEVEND